MIEAAACMTERKRTTTTIAKPVGALNARAAGKTNGNALRSGYIAAKTLCANRQSRVRHKIRKVA